MYLLIDEAIKVAKTSDKVVLALGEHQHMSGEANARGNICIPKAQLQLLEEISKLGKPISLLLFTGRPLDLTDVIGKVDSILNVWFLGTMSGYAIEKLMGKEKSQSLKIWLTEFLVNIFIQSKLITSISAQRFSVSL